MNSNMIKRVQQMQRDMKKAEEEIANTEFTITCGPVTVTVRGNYTIKAISFEEGFMPSDKEDLEMLSDMIVAATHQAQEEIVKFTEEKMQKYQALLGGFGF